MITMRSKIIQKVLRYFFMNETDEVYLSELAGIIGEDTANVHKILIKLEKEGLLGSRYRGKERFFHLNKQYPLLSAYKEIFYHKFGLIEILKSVINDMNGVLNAFVYGSFVKGKEDEYSDIDLILIGKVKRKSVSGIFSKLEKELGREINYIIYDNEEFEERKEKDPFLKRILTGERIHIK